MTLLSKRLKGRRFIINQGKPPALPERLPEFDNSWNIRKPPTVNCSKFKKEGGFRWGDHIHMMISIPPKYSVAQVAGYIKGKSAIHIARSYAGPKRNFIGQNFWAKGYYVSTTGRD
jgi:hypothetical protein